MNTLSHHIETLLLHHDCVIVPQFGAFITQEGDSSRLEADGLFFPPLRVVRFNSSLMEDDGLLVSAVRSTGHLSVTEAKRRVHHMVLDLRQQLLSDGQVDFGTIGLFLQDEDGHVSFEPCQAGAITPAYFGLDSFVMPRLSTLQRSTLQVTKRPSDATVQAGDHITIRLHRRSLRYVAASVAAVLIGLLFSSPVTEPLQRSQQATIVPTQAMEVQQPAQAMQPAVVVEQQPVLEAETVQKEETTIAEKTEENKVTSEYCIVLASDVSLKNAEAFVEQLQKKGIVNVSILEKGKFRRVVINGFATEEAASQRNAEIHRMGGDFAYSWVMKL